MSIGANNGLFTGIHNGKLDEKNRVTIPAAWRFDAEATFLAMYHPALAAIVVFPPSMAARIHDACHRSLSSLRRASSGTLGAGAVSRDCSRFSW